MSANTSRPLIGILLDYAKEGSFSSRPHYALRQAYFDAVDCAGGIPLGLPYQSRLRMEYLDRLDGFILPGGFYPFPDSYYGDRENSSEPVHPRVSFEEEFTKALLDQDKPLLGICAGMQAMGAALGAKMYRDVHGAIETHIDHLNEKPAEDIAHQVTISEGTRLHAITDCTALGVNTAHREALMSVPDGAILNAIAPDGVIEGIEVPDHRFALAVQWHPEFFLNRGDPNLAIFEALIAAARA